MKRASIEQVCIECGFCEVRYIVKQSKSKDPPLSHPLSPSYVPDFRDCLYGYTVSVLENK